MKISCHTHCESSLTASPVSTMIERAANLGRKYFTYTDLGHLGSALKVYGLAKKANLKPVLGIEFYFKDAADSLIVGTPADRCKYFTSTLFTFTQTAYQELCRVVSKTDFPKIEIQEEEQSLWSWNELEHLSKFDTLLVLGGVHDIVGKTLLASNADLAEKVLLKVKGLFQDRLYLSLICEPWNKKYASVIKLEYTDGTHDSLLASDTVTTDRARKIKVSDLIKRGGHSEILSKVVGGTFFEVGKKISNITEYKGFLPLPVDATLEINKFFLEMSKKHGIPTLASDYAFYASKEDRIVQTMVLEGSNKIKSDLHMKSQEEMESYFERELLLNKQEIALILSNNDNFAHKFDNFELKYEYRLADSGGNSLQQCMEIIKKNGRMKWDDHAYVARLREEIGVISKNGVKDFSSYFLPIHEVIAHYRDNGKLTGPSRGCLTGSAKVFVNGGIKKLEDVKIGDFVIGHTGLPRLVTNTFVFENSDPLLEIKTHFQWGTIKLTKDHRLMGVKSSITDEYSNHLSKNKTWEFDNRKFEKINIENRFWDKAENFKKDDYLFVPWPKNRVIIDFEPVDLLQFCQNRDHSYDSDFIYLHIPLDNDLANRAIHRNTKISRNCLRNIRSGKQFKFTCAKTRKILSDYLQERGLTIEEWSQLDNTKTLKIKRWLPFNSKTLDIVGRWVGDGWIKQQKGNAQWGIAFHRNDEIGKKELILFLSEMGFEFTSIEHTTKKLTQIVSYSDILSRLFKNLFPEYIYKSYSKRIGKFVNLNDDLLRSFLIGLAKADGHFEIGHRNNGYKTREAFDTTSTKMAEELKLCLLYLKIPSSIKIRKSYIHTLQNYKCRESYKIQFMGLRARKSNTLIENEDGYLAKIVEIKQAEPENVYDLTVEEDHSYLTTNYVVHNSAGGSLFCYLMGITQIDPIRYGLSFPRFLSLDRIKNGDLPDVDVDFPDRDLLAGKDGKSGFLYERWGNKAAQISTRHMVRLKSAIKDTNRYLNGSVEKDVEAFSKSLPDAPQGVPDRDFVFGYEDTDGNHHPGLIETNEGLRAYIQSRPKEWDIVQKSLGIVRSQSLHASAFAISDIPLSNLLPIKNGHITQYEAKQVEAAGILKYDFLNVSNIRDIEVCLKLINKKNNESPTIGYFTHKGKLEHIWNLPNDLDAFKSCWDGDTETIFQINTKGMAPTVMKIKPKSLDDISIILALERPGPKDFIDPETNRNMVEEYIARRNGESKPNLKELYDLIPETYGVIVFQEQSLKISKELGGMAPADAEKLRRLFSKKLKKEVDEMKPIFMSTAIPKIGEEKANKIWDMMETSSRYSFNASHSYGYGLITYAGLFLRHNYPLEWWAAILTNAKEKEISGKLWPHVKHLVAAPDINLSTDEMEIDYANHKIRAKLGVIRGMGEKTIDPIVDGRPYRDIQDFVDREVAGASLSRKLIHVGVLDSLFPPKSPLLEKLQLFEDALEIRSYNKKVEKAKQEGKTIRQTEPKKGAIPEEYLSIESDPMKNATIKKSILPSLLVGLYDLGRHHSKCIVDKIRPSKIMTDSYNNETLLVTGETLQRLDELPGDAVFKDAYVAVTAFVVGTEIFDYKKNTKQALKVIMDVDGYVQEHVVWPDFRTQQLYYPKELKKGNICTIFLKKRAGKSELCSITDIVIEA